MADINTRHYATPPASYFWKWSGDGSAIEWPDGQTLAFSQEILTILTSLAEQGGIPPLGSLLLIHAASSGQLDHFRKTSQQLIENHPDEFTSPESQTLIAAVTHSLEVITELPADLRSGTRAKAQLCHTLFHRSTWAHQDERARLIVQDLLAEPNASWHHENSHTDFSQRFLRDTSALIKATAGLTTESLEHLIRTGLEFPELSAASFDENLAPETEYSRSLLEQLAGAGPELSALAGIARQVIGLISLPQPATKNNDLPIGGVADIVNRGTPDKLLTTELAWGDTILAARLAQNEALYYHREIPPQNAPSQRLILLDHGLRYWGLPRLFALATHLGLKCHGTTAKHVKVANFIASELSHQPLQLETPKDVRAALSHLPTHLSLAPTLASLTEQITRENSDHGVCDLFLISSANSLDDPATSKNLHLLTAQVRKTGGRLYVIELTSKGHLSIFEHRSRGIRKLQEGLLDLDALLPQKSNTPKSQTPKAKLTNTDLEKLTGSKFYNYYPPPILLPAKPGFGNHCRPDGNPDLCIGISTDSHLMRWREFPDRAEELSQAIHARSHWLDCDAQGKIRVAVSGKKAGTLARVYSVTDQGHLQEIPIAGPKHAFPRNAVFQGEFIIFIYADFAEAFSLSSGEQVATRTSPEGNLHEKTIRLVNGEIAISHVSPLSNNQDFFKNRQHLARKKDQPDPIIPTHISFADRGAPILFTEADSFLLNVEKPSWEPLKNLNIHKVKLRMTLNPTGKRRFPNEDELKSASKANIIATFDPRGFLHLTNGPSSWTITTNESPCNLWKSRDHDDLRPATKDDFEIFLRNLHMTLKS